MAKKSLILITLYLIVFLNSFGYFIIMLSLSRMINDSTHGIISPWMIQHCGDYIYSIVLGAGSLASIIAAPIVGRISDRIGRRKTLIACTILMIISFIMPILSFIFSSLIIFLLGNALNGISSNTQPVSQAAIADLSNHNHSKTFRFSIDISVIVLAMTVGPLLGGFLSNPHISSCFNNQTPFWVAGCLNVITLVLILILLPETNQHLNLNQSINWQTFTDLIKLPKKVKQLLLVTILAQSAWAMYFQYLFIYMVRQFHFSNSMITYFTFCIGATMIIGIMIVLKGLLKWISLSKIITLSMICAGTAALAMGLIQQAWAQWAFMPILTAFIGLYFPCVLTLLTDHTDKHNQGWIISLSNALIGAAWFSTGFLAIFLSHLNPSYPLIASGIFLLIAFWVIKPKLRFKLIG